MYPLKKSISLALGLALLATVAVVITTGTVGASPKVNSIAAAPPTPAIPVSVVNTPLPVQGTVNANVSGTVGISSLPAVQLSGTPTVNLNTTPTAPLYVDTDRPDRNGFNASCFTGDVDPTFGQAQCLILTIPAGREVVIESLACNSLLISGNVPAQASLVMPNVSAGPFPNNPGINVPIALSKGWSTQSYDYYQVMTPVHYYGSAYSDGGVDIGIFFRTSYSASAPQGLSCTIGGHMVP